jgi:hypothetical protein
LSDVAPVLAAFFEWASERRAALARPLRRADLSLDQVARWAAHLKIIDRDAETDELRVRLFGTGMADIYGRDLTGQTLQIALPSAFKDRLLAGYETAAKGCVVCEKIDFEWPDGKNVRYERIIYPLDTQGVYGQFAVVGVRSVGARDFFARPNDVRYVASTLDVL